jgi:hypothetical protein
MKTNFINSPIDIFIFQFDCFQLLQRILLEFNQDKPSSKCSSDYDDNISIEIIPENVTVQMHKDKKARTSKKVERKEGFERARAWHLDRQREKNKSRVKK